MFLNIDVPYIHPRRPRGGPVESGKTMPIGNQLLSRCFRDLLILIIYLLIYYSIISTYHTLEVKIRKNSQSRGLKWPKVRKKKTKNLQEWKKALTKIIAIQLNQERKGQSEKNLQLKCNTW